MNTGCVRPTMPEITPDVASPRLRWTNLLAHAISIAILCAIGWQLSTIDIFGIRRIMPGGTLFWVCLLAFYMTSPLFDWLIFRHLWGMPISGIIPLLRKAVSNSLLLGYSGEAYLYTWARQSRKGPSGAIHAEPFAAIKNVAIISAIIGNVTTIALLIATAPLLAKVLSVVDLHFNAMIVSAIVGAGLATSLLMLVLYKRVLTLPAPSTRFVAAMQVARTAINIILTIWLWHLVLPQVSLDWWLLLCTWRQVVTRLPFMPNKDAAFAAIASFVTVGKAQIGELMTLMATLMIGAHIAAGLVVSMDTIIVRMRTAIGKVAR